MPPKITMNPTPAQKAAPTVKVTAPSQKPLPLSIVNPAPNNTNNITTKSVFSNNLAYYLKGSNGSGGGAKSVGNSGAVSRRT